MANSYFQFKQFLIRQDRCAMKVGTDGVLLGAWAAVSGAGRALDIGTGTGLIALMLAQKKADLSVDAIDVDVEACKQAAENAGCSPFSGRVHIYPYALDEYARLNTKRYDLIVSNPPYFVRSLKSPEEKRTLARHNDSLPLRELLKTGCALLAEKGRIALILPPLLYRDLPPLLFENGLSCRRITEVIPVPGSAPKRYLVELSVEAVPQVETDYLVIEYARHRYSSEYIGLTKDFYLKL